MFDPPAIKGIRDHVCDRAVAWAVQKVGARVVCDLGSGIGRDLVQLLDVGLIDEGFGIDAEEHKTFKVSDSPKRNELTFVKGDYRRALVWGGSKFDLAFSNNVLEHVEYPNDFLAVSLALAPYAFHTLPHERTNWDPAYHRNFWKLEELVAMCDQWGEVVEADILGSGGTMFALMKRR